MQGLYFKLIGVINDASGLSESLKRHGSIHVNGTKKGGQFAMVEFMRTADGSFVSPTTEITEKSIDYFLIQAVNTYRGGSIMIARTGEDERVKEAKVDREGIQRINIRSVGTVMRVNRQGDVEVYRVTSPTVENKKRIKVFTLFEDNLPFENERLLNAVINDDEVLREFGDDLKRVHAALQQSKFENFENKAGKREIAPVKPNTPPKTEAPVEDLIAKTETLAEPQTKSKPKTRTPKPSKKIKEGDKEAARTTKVGRVEDEKKEARKFSLAELDFLKK